MAKPWDIPVDADQSVTIAVKRILRTRTLEMFSYERGTMLGTDIEALHDMRVSARRLQAVMAIFYDCFPPKKMGAHYGKIRQLIRALGAVREDDVFIENLRVAGKDFNTRQRKAIDLLLARRSVLGERKHRSLNILLQQYRKEGYKELLLKFFTRI